MARYTDSLSREDIEKLWAAFDFAAESRHPPNAAMTISWADTKRGADEITVRFGKFKERASKWIRRRGVHLTAIYVHEKGERHAPHTHLLLSLPEPLWDNFKAKISDWIDIRLGNAVRLKPSRGPNGPSGWLKYICEGFSIQQSRRRYGIRQKDQGWVGFKRSGTTENIGSAARSRAGYEWTPPRSRIGSREDDLAPPSEVSPDLSAEDWFESDRLLALARLTGEVAPTFTGEIALDRY